MCRLARLLYLRVFRRYTGRQWVVCEDPDELGYWWEQI